MKFSIFEAPPALREFGWFLCRLGLDPGETRADRRPDYTGRVRPCAVAGCSCFATRLELWPSDEAGEPWLGAVLTSESAPVRIELRLVEEFAEVESGTGPGEGEAVCECIDEGFASADWSRLREVLHPIRRAICESAKPEEFSLGGYLVSSASECLVPFNDVTGCPVLDFPFGGASWFLDDHYWLANREHQPVVDLQLTPRRPGRETLYDPNFDLITKGEYPSKEARGARVRIHWNWATDEWTESDREATDARAEDLMSALKAAHPDLADRCRRRQEFMLEAVRINGLEYVPAVGDDDDFDLDPFLTPDCEPVVRAAPKVGRNDPCPCGSGKKAKKCCGAG